MVHCHDEDALLVLAGPASGSTYTTADILLARTSSTAPSPKRRGAGGSGAGGGGQKQQTNEDYQYSNSNANMTPTAHLRPHPPSPPLSSLMMTTTQAGGDQEPGPSQQGDRRSVSSPRFHLSRPEQHNQTNLLPVFHQRSSAYSSLIDAPTAAAPGGGGTITGDRVLIGLSVASFAGSLLTSIFGMFHVDMFLRAYRLPPSMYGAGGVAITAVNTLANVVGAYLVDHRAAAAAASSSRGDLTGLAGCLFAVCFLTPFFRWAPSATPTAATDAATGTGLWWDCLHYVGSLSLYYAGFSFSSILMASVVNDDHHMSDRARVNYMASGKLCNLVGSLTVTRIGLALFDVNNLLPFRVFILVLVVVACSLFVLAQFMIFSDDQHHRQEALEESKGHAPRLTFRRLLFPRLTRRSYYRAQAPFRVDDQDRERKTAIAPTLHRKQPQNAQLLHWKQVARDFWSHSNFRSWIGMELVLEAQTTFSSFFLKTFVDGLLLDSALGRTSCDWLLSLVRPCTEIVSVLIMYLGIRRYGYAKVYRQLFYWNLAFSSALLYVINSARSEDGNTAASVSLSMGIPRLDRSAWILAFLVVYPVVTGAVQSAGFHLAQADMVLEMKRNHALEGRYDEPSLAALFMGANALFCKPAESILPITAATVLDMVTPRGDGTGLSNVYRDRLLYLLALPPVFCSIVQLVVWRNYDLTPYKTSRLRDELKKLRSRSRPYHWVDSTTSKTTLMEVI